VYNGPILARITGKYFLVRLKKKKKPSIYQKVDCGLGTTKLEEREEKTLLSRQKKH